MGNLRHGIAANTFGMVYTWDMTWLYIWVYYNDVWQSEPTDGPTSGWRQRSVVEVAVVLVAEMSL